MSITLKLDPHAVHSCSICGWTYIGYGHNAQPVNNGRCCNDCNAAIVVPLRIRNITKNLAPSQAKA